jgi:hypothetical protein
MYGREKTPEQEAEEIMNQSDEGMEDMLEGTELDLGDDEMPDDSDLMSDMGIERESDDGGDYTDF